MLLNKNSWSWTPSQEEAVNATKQELLKRTTLASYNPNASTQVSVDALSFGLGAALLQKNANEWEPIAFDSRSMTEVEHQYAQIEKEALTATLACKKFTDYILGAKFTVEIHHKPLVPLPSTTHLHNSHPEYSVSNHN